MKIFRKFKGRGGRDRNLPDSRSVVSSIDPPLVAVCS